MQPGFYLRIFPAYIIAVADILHSACKAMQCLQNLYNTVFGAKELYSSKISTLNFE